MKQIDIKNTSNQPLCPKCGNDEFYRCKRSNNFEKLISLIGLFPYLCYYYGCRKKVLIFSSKDYFKTYGTKTLILTLSTASLICFFFIILISSISLNQIARLFSFISYSDEYIEVNNKLLNYQNLEKGIQLKYPGSWEKKELPDPLTGEIVTFVSPQESEFDPFREKVIVHVEVLSNKYRSLDEYKNSSYAEIQKFLKDAVILESSITTLGNLPAYKIIYSGKYSDSTGVANMEVVTVKNNQAYRITYIADSSNYNKFSKNAEAMVNSFKFLK
ncbi:MAG: PsbP-related protein [Crinalium sp.]